MLAQLFPLPLDNFLDCSLTPLCRHCVIACLEEQLLLLGYFNISLTLATLIEGKEK